jgi:Flp pilus assembly CpaF family ATPase
MTSNPTNPNHPGSLEHPVNRVDMLLVQQLHRQVGARLQVEQASRKARGLLGLLGESERQYARKLIADGITDHVEALLNGGESPLPHDVEHATGEAVYARMYGAGRLQRLLDDTSIENIDINGCDEVWVRRADGTKERGEPVAATDEELVELVQTLASYAGRSSRPFDAANVELDLRLPDGSRMSAVLEVSGRPAVSIRRHRFEKVTLADLVGNDTLTPEAADFLAAVVSAKFNIVIAGGTDTGKTTMLRALASEIGPEERVVTVENSLELGLRADTARHPDCTELEARIANSEGRGAVSMDQLVRRSLRMNPDRVIVGEVLGPEIIQMLQAMSQGNDGSLSTLHARTGREVFERISTYALTAEQRMPREAAFSLIAGGLDFVIFLRKDRGSRKRRLTQVLEVNGFDPATGVASSELFAAGSDGVAQRTNVSVSEVRRDGMVTSGWADPVGEWA